MKGNLVDVGNSEVVCNSKLVGNFQVVGSSKFARNSKPVETSKWLGTHFLINYLLFSDSICHCWRQRLDWGGERFESRSEFGNNALHFHTFATDLRPYHFHRRRVLFALIWQHGKVGQETHVATSQSNAENVKNVDQMKLSKTVKKNYESQTTLLDIIKSNELSKYLPEEKWYR